MASMARPVPNIDQYVLTEKLGSGSYATVYKAFKKKYDREVLAVKCVLKSSLTKSSTENLLTEIDLLKKLKHENIVELKDFHWDANYIYLLMEFCSGGDLSKFIQSKRTISERYSKKFMQQIANALRYLNSNSVAHMDLKPQNILLSSKVNPKLKIADFGFAHNLKTGDEMMALRGSPLYMAPEILCQGHYDARVDLWSVGVIFYECLFGRAPFASPSYKELGKKIWDQKPIKIPYDVNISDECRSLLFGLLQRDPNERLSFNDFFNHPFIDLDHLASSQSLSKATQLVQEAIEMDEAGNAQRALSLYCEALSHFVPAIHYEDNMARKEALRNKVSQYTSRAEVLKTQVCPENSSKLSSSPAPLTALLEQLISVYSEKSETVAALRLVTIASSESERQMFNKALEHYELALGHLLKISSTETNIEYKELLKKLVSGAMTHAEQVKMRQASKNLQTARVMETEFYADEASSTQCSLQ